MRESCLEGVQVITVKSRCAPIHSPCAITMMTARQQPSSCVTCVVTCVPTVTASSTCTDALAPIRDRSVVPTFTCRGHSAPSHSARLGACRSVNASFHLGTTCNNVYTRVSIRKICHRTRLKFTRHLRILPDISMHSVRNPL